MTPQTLPGAEVAALASRLASLGARDRALVVGHSNTVPQLLRALKIDTAVIHQRQRLRQPLHRRPREGIGAVAAPVEVLMARERLHGNLSTVEYFTFGFGTMVGVGWVVLMDDWLSRGGPGGAMLGFLLGGLLLFPVAYTYGRLVQRIRDAGAEIAYTEGVFPPSSASPPVDDGAGLRDRLPVGGGGDRQPAGARLPGAEPSQLYRSAARRSTRRASPSAWC